LKPVNRLRQVDRLLTQFFWNLINPFFRGS
jgi:hypothetical protein